MLRIQFLISEQKEASYIKNQKAGRINKRNLIITKQIVSFICQVKCECESESTRVKRNKKEWGNYKEIQFTVSAKAEMKPNNFEALVHKYIKINSLKYL
jgi:hypothetical protein